MKLKIDDDKVSIIETSNVEAGEYNVTECEFEFSEHYDGLVKKAVFTNHIGNTYKVDIVNNKCAIPVEVLTDSATVTLGVYGYEIENEEFKLRYSPTPTKFWVNEGSYIANAQNSDTPTPTEFEQLEQRVTTAEGDIDDLENTVAGHTTDISELQATVRENTSDIDTLQDNVRDLSQGVSENAQDIETINGDINTLTQTVADNLVEAKNYTDSEIDSLATVAKTGDYNDLNNKPFIPTKTSDLTNDSGFIDKNVNNLTNYTVKTSTGSLIDLEINGTTYVVTLRLKDIDGNVISTDTIDLPLESVVIGGSFDAENKKIVLTLENGQTVEIPVGDLVAGLQTEITSNNKLASDLVDDTNSGNKFTNTSEKNGWNAKYDKPSGGIPKTDLASSVQESLGKADTALQEHQDISGKEDKLNKVTEISSSSTDVQYPSAKCVYDSQANQDELIAELQDQIDDLNTEYETNAISGESIDTTDSAQARADIGINGNSKQNSTEGYQLFDKSAITTEALNADGTTSTSSSLSTTDFIEIDSSQQYYKTVTGSQRVKLYDENKSVISTSSIADISNFTGEGVFSIPEASAKYIRFSFANENVDTIMFAQSSTAVPYEPYTGGQASPNPNYEQPIYSAGDNINLAPSTLYNTQVNQQGEINTSTNRVSNVATNSTSTLSVKAGTYTISIDNLDYCSLLTKDSQGNIIDNMATSWHALPYTFTLTADGFLYFTGRKDGNPNITASNYAPKLEKGSIVTPYSPYNMGCITEKVHNDNIIDTTTFTNGQLNTDGTVTNVQYRITSDYIPAKANSTYYVDWNYSDDNLYLIYSTYDENKNHIARTIPNNKTITTTADTKYIKICLSRTVNQALNVSDISNFMLSSSQHDYIEPKSQSYIIPTQQPMRSIGTVRDVFVETDNGWVERHYIGEIVLDGTETGWTRNLTTNFYRYYLNKDIGIKTPASSSTSLIAEILSNKFQAKTMAETWGGKTGISTGYPTSSYEYTRLCVCYVSDDTDTEAKFKTWLSNNNVTIDYQLQTPTDLPCTAEQIQALETIKKAKTYQGVTHIYSEDTIPAYIEIEYKKSNLLRIKALENA